MAAVSMPSSRPQRECRARASLLMRMKNLLMIAPQASAASTVLAAAQCGQRVNEWGQAGGNSPPLMPPSGHDAGGELSPACPHVRLRHSRFAHTESAHADPAARSPHGRAVTSRVPTVDPTPEWRTPSDDGARSRSEEANLRIGGKSDLRSNRVSTAGVALIITQATQSPRDTAPETEQVFHRAARRSLDGAQRNPGPRCKSRIRSASARSHPDSATLHPGYGDVAANTCPISGAVSRERRRSGWPGG